MAYLNLLENLANPDNWLSGVLRNFVVSGFDRSSCAIRVGKTGTRGFPNYKIEWPSYLLPMTLARGVVFNFTVTPGENFNGRYHRNMGELDSLERHDSNWSAPINIDDIEHNFNIRKPRINKENHQFFY